MVPGSEIQQKNTAPRFELVLDNTVATEINPENNLPDKFSLDQNYPNPFNPTTQINYAVPKAGNILLEVYDMLGRKVSTLVDERLSPGNYSVNFDASKLASGVYVYRLKSGSVVMTKKLTLIK